MRLNSTYKRLPATRLTFSFLSSLLGVLIVIGLAISLTACKKVEEEIYDVEHSFSIILKAKTGDGSAPTSDQINESCSIIENRLTSLGADKALAKPKEDSKINVLVEGLEDEQTVIETICKPGKVCFTRCDSITDVNVKEKITSDDFNKITDRSNKSDSVQNETKNSYIEIEEGTYAPLFTNKNIESAKIERETTSPNFLVDIELDADGTEALAEASKELVSTKGKIAIIFDNVIISALPMQTEILNGAIGISNNYSSAEAKSLAAILENNPMPLSLETADS